MIGNRLIPKHFLLYKENCLQMVTLLSKAISSSAIRRGIFLTKRTFLSIIIFTFGLVAQLGERTVRIRKVEGSIPFESTIFSMLEVCYVRPFL